jgi:hypothetical protein
MRKISLVIALALTSLCASADAGVVLFDDLVSGQFVGSYGGFNWDANIFVCDNSRYQSDYGNTYSTTSPENFVSNGFGVISTKTTSGADFDFNGAYFSTWAFSNRFDPQQSSTSVTLQGWDDGGIVGSVTAALSSTQFNWVAANFASIDELRMINDGAAGRWWIMDNFTFNQTVPEPASVAVWSLLGMVGIGYRWQRKRRSSRAS